MECGAWTWNDDGSSAVLEHEWKVDMEKPITEIIHADNYEQGMKENELTIEVYHSHALRQPELLCTDASREDASE